MRLDELAPACAPRPLAIVVFHGAFHGNATRAAFSASPVFRSHGHSAVLVEFAARLLRPGGTLVFSTCSLAPQENEHNVRC